MKKYKVLRTNYGFQNRYWTQGEVANFEDEVHPPHHFQPLDEWERSSQGQVEMRRDPMKPETFIPGKYPLTKKTGFAASIIPAEDAKEPMTAGKALKDKK